MLLSSWARMDGRPWLLWLLEQTMPQELLLATLLFCHSVLSGFLFISPGPRLQAQVSAPPADGLFLLSKQTLEVPLVQTHPGLTLGLS